MFSLFLSIISIVAVCMILYFAGRAVIPFLFSKAGAGIIFLLLVCWVLSEIVETCVSDSNKDSEALPKKEFVKTDQEMEELMKNYRDSVMKLDSYYSRTHEMSDSL